LIQQDCAGGDEENVYSPSPSHHHDHKKADTLTRSGKKRLAGGGTFNSSFIKCLADLLSTKDASVILRSLSKHFNRAMRDYLP